MKKLCFLLLTVGLVSGAFGQDKVASQVTLALNNNSAIKVNSDAVFTLNAGTREFNAIINLFPIVPNPDMADSAAIRDKPLQLKLHGRFPAGDISFFSYRDNDKKYSMPCRCQIYDSVRDCQVNFTLITSQEEQIKQISGTAIYQSRLNFMMMIDSRDYDLYRQPFAIVFPIFIIAKNAVINKIL